MQRVAGLPPIPGRPDVARPFPSRPDAPPPGPRRHRFIALGLVLSLLGPGVLGLLAHGPYCLCSTANAPWTDGEPVYAFLDRRADGSPYRWEPCLPIHYEVNLEHAPPGAMNDVMEAIERLSDASGLEFVLDGQTDRTP